MELLTIFVIFRLSAACISLSLPLYPSLVPYPSLSLSLSLFRCIYLPIYKVCGVTNSIFVLFGLSVSLACIALSFSLSLSHCLTLFHSIYLFLSLYIYIFISLSDMSNTFQFSCIFIERKLEIFLLVLIFV